VRREKLLLNLKKDIDEMMGTPFVLFIRANTFETVGIMTKIIHKYDSSWGTMRPWAIGLTLGDGKRFEEPLDRKNKRTGELEDIIQMKTNTILITARNTGDPDDDDDDNFSYLLSPHQSNRMKDSLDRIKERDRIIHDLQKKLDEIENQRDYYHREAEASGSEIRNLRARVSLLSEKVADVEQQASHYRTELKKAHIGRLEGEGAIDERLSDARKRGAFEAKDSSDVIIDAAKKQVNAKQELSKLGMGDISPEYATKADIKTMEQRLAAQVKEIANRPIITPERKETPKTQIIRKESPPEE